MPVPLFDGRGLLPPFDGTDETTANRSPYAATMSEVVTALGTTPARKALLAGLLGYRELLGTLGYVDGMQFINGSFVEDVERREGRPPNDIDVFSFLMRPAQYRQNPALWTATGLPEFRSEVADRNTNKRRFNMDAYAVTVDNMRSPLELMIATVYWYSLFAHKRVTHDWKGFLRVPLNDVDDAAAKALL